MCQLSSLERCEKKGQYVIQDRKKRNKKRKQDEDEDSSDDNDEGWYFYPWLCTKILFH